MNIHSNILCLLTENQHKTMLCMKKYSCILSRFRNIGKSGIIFDYDNINNIIVTNDFRKLIKLDSLSV